MDPELAEGTDSRNDRTGLDLAFLARASDSQKDIVLRIQSHDDVAIVGFE